MEAIKCIKTRRSVRDFISKEVPDEVLEEIVEAACFAPSWKNSQTCRYIVIKDKAMRSLIADKCTLGFEHNKMIVHSATALVVVVQKKGICGYEKDGSHSTPKGDRWQMFDAGIAAQTFCLTAWDKGIGSVILGMFDDYLIEHYLNLYKFESAAALIAIGYPADIPDAPKRKPLDVQLKILGDNSNE